MSEIIEYIPGNSVNAAGQRGGVDVEEANCPAVVQITRKQSRDVGTELVVSWMPDCLTVYYYRNRGAIDGNFAGTGSQGPAEIDICIAGRSAALSWRVDGTEWFGSEPIVDHDSFRSQIQGVAGLVMCNGMQLESSVA